MVLGADVLLSEGEDKRLVRQNLKAAAEELGIALDFKPIKDKSRIHFRVVTLEEKAAQSKRAGRSRKTSRLRTQKSSKQHKDSHLSKWLTFAIVSL